MWTMGTRDALIFIGLVAVMVAVLLLPAPVQQADAELRLAA
jgi:hypothetical protein